MNFLFGLLFHDRFMRIVSNFGLASLTLALFEELTLHRWRLRLPGDLELPLLVKKLVAAFLDVEHLLGFCYIILRYHGVVVL